MNTTTFDTAFQELNSDMMKDYKFTSLHRNPLLCADVPVEKLMIALNDYCGLPRIITRLLEKGRTKATTLGMKEIAGELALNLSEERGQDPRSQTPGIPHYEMLKRGLKKEFDFTPTSTVRPETERFLGELTEVIGSESTGRVFGAIYALESSANPELLVVRRLFEVIAKTREVALASKEALSLIWFIEIHTETYEVDHESRLKTAIIACLDERELPDFEHGFRTVMILMETWWKNMAKF